MKTSIENGYKTRDLGEGAALVVSGLKIKDIQRDGRVCWFIFEKSKKCGDTSREYYFGNLQGNLRQYNDAMNVLKNRIYSNLG